MEVWCTGRFSLKGRGGAGVGIEEGSGEEWKWEQRGEWKQKSLKGRGGQAGLRSRCFKKRGDWNPFTNYDQVGTVNNIKNF